MSLGITAGCLRIISAELDRLPGEIASSRRHFHLHYRRSRHALIGLIAPVLPKLVLTFLNNDMRRAANWNGIFLTVFAAMQFFFSPVIGVLSDRIGRRPVLLLRALDSVSITS